MGPFGSLRAEVILATPLLSGTIIAGGNYRESSELLNVEVVRSHGCANFLRICENCLLLNTKQVK